MKTQVIGQTGRTVLSDEAIQYKLAKKRTVRYQYARLNVVTENGIHTSGIVWMAWICGPFHSRTYGVCGLGTKKGTAKAALKKRLANEYGYIGHMLFSDVDDADTIGLSSAEVWHRANNVERDALCNADQRPISICEAHGSAGM